MEKTYTKNQIARAVAKILNNDYVDMGDGIVLVPINENHIIVKDILNKLDDKDEKLCLELQ